MELDGKPFCTIFKEELPVNDEGKVVQHYKCTMLMQAITADRVVLEKETLAVLMDLLQDLLIYAGTK